MYRFLLAFLLINGLIGCTPRELPTITQYEKAYLSVMLSHQSTRPEMEIIKKEIAQRYDIKVDFSGSEFFDDGRLQSLAVQVFLPSGSFAKGAAELLNLQFQYFGFSVSDISTDRARLWIGQVEQE